MSVLVDLKKKEEAEDSGQDGKEMKEAKESRRTDDKVNTGEEKMTPNVEGHEEVVNKEQQLGTDNKMHDTVTEKQPQHQNGMLTSNQYEHPQNYYCLLKCNR